MKAYYASAYRPDLTSIVVVGDVTPARVRSAIEKAFGGWSATGPAPDVFPPAVPRNRPSTVTIPATGRVQTDVTLAETLPLSYSDADFPVLHVGNAALTGGRSVRFCITTCAKCTATPTRWSRRSAAVTTARNSR